MNGKYKLLVDQEIEACEITKVRFNLGSDCSVKSLLTGNVSELKTRGSFMFDVDWDIQEGEDYTYIIDIDASQSIKIALTQRLILSRSHIFVHLLMHSAAMCPVTYIRLLL